MKIFEVISRREAEKQWASQIAKKPQPISSKIKPTTQPSSSRIHTIKQTDQESKPIELDTFKLNRIMDKKLALIKTNLSPKFNTLVTRAKNNAREFNHSLPEDWLKIDNTWYLLPPPDSPLFMKGSMMDRYDHLIQVYKDKIKQLQDYLKYPLKYNF